MTYQEFDVGALKILFLVQLPPPVHGASVINATIKDSALINSEIECEYVNISPALDVGDIGRASLSKLVSSFKILLSALSRYLRFHPDLVYMTLSPTGIALLKDSFLAILLKFFGAQPVFHMHGKGVLRQSKRSLVHKLIYSITFKNSHVIHLSKIFFSEVSQFIPPERFHVVRNGVKYPTGAHNREDAPIKLLYLSNLVREKGALELLDACHLLKDHRTDFTLTFSGRFFDDSMRSDFFEKLSIYDMPNVKIIEGAYGDQKLELLQESHIMILPTQSDCFPLVLLEAMAYKMAVISTHEGAIPEIVDHGKTGLLVDICSGKNLAEAIRFLIDNPSEREAMSLAGEEKFYLNYTEDCFEKNLLTTLKDIYQRSTNSESTS